MRGSPRSAGVRNPAADHRGHTPSPDAASPHAGHCRVEHHRTAVFEPALQAHVRMLVVHLQRVSVSNGAAPRNADRSLHACLTATVMQKPQHSHISCVALKAACKGGGAGVSAPAEGVARRLAGRRGARHLRTFSAGAEKGAITSCGIAKQVPRDGRRAQAAGGRHGRAATAASPRGACAHRATVRVCAPPGRAPCSKQRTAEARSTPLSPKRRFGYFSTGGEACVAKLTPDIFGTNLF